MTEAAATARSVEERRLVGGEGVWTFILADISLFAAMFASFSWAWRDQIELFSISQARLHPAIGVINTLVLITSSLCVARSVQEARRGSMLRARPLLSGAIVCGVAFVVIKVFEYRAEITAGALLTTNDFFMYYYVMTGIHLLHVIIGIAALSFLYGRLPRLLQPDSDVALLETGAAYWHMVDLLWIFLFPLLYLVH